MSVFPLEEAKLGAKAPIKADFSEMKLEGPESLVQMGRFQVLLFLPVNQHILLCSKESHFAAPAGLQHS